MAVHVMLVASSIEDTISLSVVMRMFCASFTATGIIKTPRPLSNCCPLACQVKLLATAVQVNSTTVPIGTMTSCGGMVISTMIIISG